MNDAERKQLELVANTIRGLTMDATQKAGCGHPGLPMGCAEIGAYLYGKEMTYNPDDPQWLGRDRFVLSGGHGSMLLYSLLHLSGYGLSLEEVKNFRQLGSKTPGHPEYGHTVGVETTTGPLGQGFATGVGMALGNKMMAARFGVENEGLLDGQIFVLASDGCIMEGVTNEASSLAGHLKLDNLIVIYDSNDICLDGPTYECLSEDTATRYKGLGWHVTTIDGHDLGQIEEALQAARKRTGQPSLVIARTTIGRPAPHKQGTSAAHGSALGEEEVNGAKEHMGWPVDKKFYIPDEVKEHFANHRETLKKREQEWTQRWEKWTKANPDKAKMWTDFVTKKMPDDIVQQIYDLDIAANSPGRKASNAILQKLHDIVPFLVGGSADLSGSDNTMMKEGGIVSAENYANRNMKYGVREFAACCATSGLALQGMIMPYVGTFLVFSDYMRNALRLASMMKLRVVYQFTHDSIFLGEDGPTHQPIEHIASLRAMPGMTVIRPADSNEMKAAWSWILTHDHGPVALVTTRQKLTDIERTAVSVEEGLGRGGYIVKHESRPERIDYCLMASGSEVALALDVAEQLETEGKSVRVISMPSFEIFDAQDKAYQDSVIPKEAGQFWSLEAARSFGWYRYIGREGRTISVDTFGESAPLKDVAEHFGFTPEKVLERIRAEQ